MSAFPSSPTNGQTANVNGVLYTYSSSLTAWQVSSSGGALTSASALTVSGNITGGNLITSGLVTSTSNVIANNISTTNAYFTKTIQETVTVNASAFASPSNFDLLTQGVWYSTANATANITVNIRGNASVTADTMLAVGQSVTFALLITNGATAYYPNLFQVDSSNVTPKYQGGTAFSGGNTNSTDVYTLTLIKTAATPTYTLLASQTKFA